MGLLQSTRVQCTEQRNTCHLKIFKLEFNTDIRQEEAICKDKKMELGKAIRDARIVENQRVSRTRNMFNNGGVQIRQVTVEIR